MDGTLYKGTISFINHDKHYATIDYDQEGRKKTINFKTNEKEPVKSKAGKKHQFRVGDEVNFRVKLAERGDRMVAYDIKFLYNTELEKLLSKAALENRFSGYLKVVDDELFVKEWDSYIFFPLKLSKWEKPPAESAFNQAISFRLLNLEKPHAMVAELFSHDYIPEYRKALEHQKNKTPVEATVTRVSPFAVYVDLFGKMSAKIPTAAGPGELKPGDSVTVKIIHISSDRIVVELLPKA